MDGTLYPIQGRTPLVAYKGGEKNGSTVLPRTRFNHDHMVRLCSHHQFVECYENHGDQPCADGCGYVDGVDDKAQMLVAESFNARAALKKPKLILNVGDNLYWGG